MLSSVAVLHRLSPDATNKCDLVIGPCMIYANGVFSNTYLDNCVLSRCFVFGVPAGNDFRIENRCLDN